MRKIDVGAFVTVKPTVNERTGVTAPPFVGRVKANRTVIEDGSGGWYLVTESETGEEREALASIVREIRPVIVPGYNDDQLTPEEIRASESIGLKAGAVRTPEVETRWCTTCLRDKIVKREYTTLAASDPTTAYELACGHHTIDL